VDRTSSAAVHSIGTLANSAGRRFFAFSSAEDLSPAPPPQASFGRTGRGSRHHPPPRFQRPNPNFGGQVLTLAFAGGCSREPFEPPGEPGLAGLGLPFHIACFHRA